LRIGDFVTEVDTNAQICVLYPTEKALQERQGSRKTVVSWNRYQSLSPARREVKVWSNKLKKTVMNPNF